MDNLLIERIDLLLEHVYLIEKDLIGKTLDDFKQSSLLTRATAFSLMQIAEQMNGLEKYYKESNPNLPWKNARNMRNLIVHVYNDVDPKIVFDTASNDLFELKEAFTKIKANLLAQA